MNQYWLFNDLRLGECPPPPKIEQLRSFAKGIGLRKLYNTTVADKEHPEALEDLLQSKPKYKNREVACSDEEENGRCYEAEGGYDNTDASDSRFAQLNLLLYLQR